MHLGACQKEDFPSGNNTFPLSRLADLRQKLPLPHSLLFVLFSAITWHLLDQLNSCKCGVSTVTVTISSARQGCP